MSKKMGLDWPCPGCQKKTTINFKQPNAVEKRTVIFNCSGCGSRVVAKIKKPKFSTDPLQIVHSVERFIPTENLKIMLLNRAAKNYRRLKRRQAIGRAWFFIKSFFGV